MRINKLFRPNLKVWMKVERFNPGGSIEMARRSAKEEETFVGISSGASLAAVAKKQDEIPAGSRVLIFSYDTGERYLSIEDLFV